MNISAFQPNLYSSAVCWQLPQGIISSRFTTRFHLDSSSCVNVHMHAQIFQQSHTVTYDALFAISTTVIQPYFPFFFRAHEYHMELFPRDYTVKGLLLRSWKCVLYCLLLWCTNVYTLLQLFFIFSLNTNVVPLPLITLPALSFWFSLADLENPLGKDALFHN